MVNMGELFANRRIGDVPMERVPLHEKHPDRDLLAEHDLLFARQSIVADGAGKVSLFLGADEPITFESHLIRARIDRNKADPEWLFYFFESSLGRDRIKAIVYQTAAAGIRGSDLARVSVACPDIEEQHRIAAVLRSLDDKVESNRSLAKTLEEIAAALFKARFVDFVDHDDLVESEIGPIPRGWGVGSAYQVADVTYGRPFKSALFGDEGVPLIRIRDLAGDEPSVRTPEQREDARLVTAGDILVGMDGEFRAHLWSGPDAWLNQRVCAFDPRAGVSKVFLLEAIKRPLAFFEATKSGTTVIHLGKRDIDTFRVVLPPDSVMQEFAGSVDPLLSTATALRLESRTLVSLRDALLPRLISGEIRVPKTALEVEAA